MVLTSASAVMAATEARSVPEVVFRLVSPLVAAWLWERGMRIERRRITGLRGIHWRLTPERVLVRLGLADATDRTTEQVATQRMLTKVALAAHRARATATSSAPDSTTATTATARMRAYWDEQIAAGRIPTGAELARVVCCSDQWGRKMRAIWKQQLTPEQRAQLTGAAA